MWQGNAEGYETLYFTIHGQNWVQLIISNNGNDRFDFGGSLGKMYLNQTWKYYRILNSV